jgi:integrase
LVRDFDGVTRHIERRGRTRNAAEQALKKALRDRTRSGANDKITAFTKVRVLGALWFTELSGNGSSPNTIQLYRDRLDRQVILSLGGLYVHERTTSVVDRHLRAVVSTHGAGTAKTVRSVLSGMCALAVRHDALTVNPVREIRLTSPKPKDAPRALTIAEARQILAWVHMTTTPSSMTYPTSSPFWWLLAAASVKRSASPGIASILIMEPSLLTDRPFASKAKVCA